MLGVHTGDVCLGCVLSLPSPVYHMKETGWVKISADNVALLHYEYQAEKAAAATGSATA